VSVGATVEAQPSKRRPLDSYYTPDALAVAIVQRCKRDGYILPDDMAIEPSCGGGAFVRALAGEVLDVLTVDIDPDVNAKVTADFLALESVSSTKHGAPMQHGADLIIGNPPYSHAEAHVRHALSLAPRVVFLLRLAFLEGQSRRVFWREHPASHVWVLHKRPSFTGGGTDNCAYGVFAWNQDGIASTRLSHLDWGTS